MTDITAENAAGIRSAGWSAMQHIADLFPDGWEVWLTDTEWVDEDGEEFIPDFPDKVRATVKVLVAHTEVPNPDRASEAAAMWGLAENVRMPDKDRLACALKALAFYGRGVQ